MTFATCCDLVQLPLLNVLTTRHLLVCALSCSFLLPRPPARPVHRAGVTRAAHAVCVWLLGLSGGRGQHSRFHVVRILPSAGVLGSVLVCGVRQGPQEPSI